MKNIVDKISSYNLFNYLFPGALFCFLLKNMVGIEIYYGNWIELFVIYYFIGIIISRIGSLLIETPLKTIKIRGKPLLHFSPYCDYIKASKTDSFLSTMTETNNMYRSLLSCLTCIFILIILSNIKNKCNYNIIVLLQNNIDVLTLIFIIILFLVSYVKETAYISKRVDACNNENNITKEKNTKEKD